MISCVWGILINMEQRIRENLDKLKIVMKTFNDYARRNGALVPFQEWKEEAMKSDIDSDTFNECVDIMILRGNILSIGKKQNEYFQKF